MEDDIKTFGSVIKNTKYKNSIIEFLIKISNQEKKDEDMMRLIIFIDRAIVGVYSCIRYLENCQGQKTRQGGKDTIRTSQDVNNTPISIPPPPQQLTVALRLIVPAYVANDIKVNNPIHAPEIEKLIDNAPYFLCTKIAEPDVLEQRLELTDENFSTVGERREVYIKIHIADGQEMLDKKVPYYLKRNLPSHGQGVVKQVACLRNLSGLEQFNRV